MKHHDYQLQLGQTIVSFTRYSQGAEKFFFVRVHGDELDAQVAGLWAIQEYGGVFLDINNPTREVFFAINHSQFSFDPNRIFTEQGIKQNLIEGAYTTNKFEISQIQKFSDFVITSMQGFNTIVALHNNEEFNIDFYLPGGECYGSAQEIHVDSSQHKHDLIIVTQLADFESCKACRLNVVLQNNQQADHNGGLSEYCSKNNIRYFNIEYYKGHLEQQKQAIKKIINILNAQ